MIEHSEIRLGQILYDSASFKLKIRALLVQISKIFIWKFVVFSSSVDTIIERKWRSLESFGEFHTLEIRR